MDASYIRWVEEELRQFALKVGDPEGTSREVKIGHFLRPRGIDRRSFYTWIKCYPDLNELYQEVRVALGDRREQRGLERSYDSALVRTSMHKYDPEWREIDEFHATINKASTTQGNVINLTVVDQPILETEAVTRKLENGSNRPTSTVEQVQKKALPGGSI